MRTTLDILNQAPDINAYEQGVLEFIEISKNWKELEYGKFYSFSNEIGYYESYDNAYGGFDVSWAFHKKPTKNEIFRQYMKEIKERQSNL